MSKGLGRRGSTVCRSSGPVGKAHLLQQPRLSSSQSISKFQLWRKCLARPSFPGILWQLLPQVQVESAFLPQAGASPDVGLDTTKVSHSAFRRSPMPPGHLSAGGEWESMNNLESPLL